MAIDSVSRGLVLLPFLIAIVAIGAIEAILSLAGTSGRFNTDFFDFSPLEQDNLQKHTIYDKFELVLGNVPSDVVQVGDSSGLYGVDPMEVMKTSGDITYLNLSCCADAGWTGYFEQAKLALKRPAPLPKLIVLHVTPFWSPAAPRVYGDNALAVLIRDYLVKAHWWHKVRPPSAGYRLRMLNAVYYGEWLDDMPYEEWTWPTAGYPGVRTWRAMLATHRGWIPIPVDLQDPVVKAKKPVACPLDEEFSQNTFLGLSHRDTLYDYLKEFAELARSAHVRFAFVTTPVPCIVSHGSIYEDVERQMRRFKADYPDAAVPFEFFYQEPLEDFSDRYHLNTEGVRNHSHRIGQAVRSIMTGGH